MLKKLTWIRRSKNGPAAAVAAGLTSGYFPTYTVDMELNKIPKRYQNDIKRAVNLLKNEGCQSVYLFGSMVTGKIQRDSDIDMGITGLPPKKFFRVSANLEKESSKKIDLVDFDLCKDFYTLLYSLGEVVELG